MNILYRLLEWAMSGCYFLCHNYGISIILFTLLSKLILLPLSVWVQKNSIKMLKMQPELNRIKIKYFGNKDIIAEEQSKIFQREKYNPLVSVVPLIIQIILLLGLIHVIQAGISNPQINMEFLEMQLSTVPGDTGGISIIWPVMAGISALLLCMVQNNINVLQSEQTKLNQYGMMILSVGLSLYLGWFVPAGVALYWIASNLMAIIQMYLLNWFINPEVYVDYESLEKSKKELLDLEKISGGKTKIWGDSDSRREKEDYKRFFSIVNKHIVFYSEKSGFYKYYEGIIEYLLKHTNIVIHYITSDPEDAVFQLAEAEKNIKAYYIAEKKLITLMMKMDADMVVMTMPDLENYHIKRSYVRKDIEYLYVQHGMGSVNMTFRKGALDYFDTVLCVGKHQKEEIEKTEAVYHLPRKKVIECGYPLLDKMRKDFQQNKKETDGTKTILIAPSWQDKNIMESCLDSLLESLINSGYRIIVRPHPQHVRHHPDKMEQLKKRYEDHQDIEIQIDFSSNRTVFEANMMVTDWSDIAYEYAYTTCRPVLFINTPMKVMNPEYRQIDVEPLNIWVRNEIGKVIELDDIHSASEIVEQMISSLDYYYDKINQIVHEYVYHLGASSQIAAEYIIGQIQKKAEERKEKKYEKKNIDH